MASQPVYVRVVYDDFPGEPGTGRTILFEVLPDGRVAREVVCVPGGVPVYHTRPGVRPVADRLAPPGSPAFEEEFGGGQLITAEEFEALYAVAEAHLG